MNYNPRPTLLEQFAEARLAWREFFSQVLEAWLDFARWVLRRITRE